MTASAHFTAHADGTLTCRYGHVVPDGQLADHLHPEPNRNTAPTPGDTYALIAARQRQQAIDAAKADVTRLSRARGPHHPDTDDALDRLGRLRKEDQ